MANDSGIWRESMDERRPDYILAIRAQALDRVQELIEPHENDDVPPPDVWRKIVDAAFPPPPMAGRSVSDDAPMADGYCNDDLRAHIAQSSHRNDDHAR